MGRGQKLFPGWTEKLTGSLPRPLIYAAGAVVRREPHLMACAQSVAKNRADHGLPSRKRPCDSHATEKGDELAPPHSITSSARAITVAGISRPIAFAVFKLITNSNVTGWAIGRSSGLVPRKILSV
jgi:hypothetical protein